ncbi:unnamed protein product [Sphacelaria rigidula]
MGCQRDPDGEPVQIGSQSLRKTVDNPTGVYCTRGAAILGVLRRDFVKSWVWLPKNNCLQPPSQLSRTWMMMTVEGSRGSISGEIPTVKVACRGEDTFHCSL